MREFIDFSSRVVAHFFERDSEQGPRFALKLSCKLTYATVPPGIDAAALRFQSAEDTSVLRARYTVRLSSWA
jgi:hypothetical protein